MTYQRKSRVVSMDKITVKQQNLFKAAKSHNMQKSKLVSLPGHIKTMTTFYQKIPAF